MLHMSKQNRTDGRSGSLRQDQRGDGRDADQACPPDVAANLRRLRHEQGYSLEALAKRSGVSRAMLGQIETGKSIPTIALIWKVSNALGIPVAALIVEPKQTRASIIEPGAAPTVVTSDGRYRIRTYARTDALQPFDFSEILIAAGHREALGPYAWGARATLLVTRGTVEITLGREPPAQLSEGAAILFHADCEHSLFNPSSSDATAFLTVAQLRNGAV